MPRTSRPPSQGASDPVNRQQRPFSPSRNFSSQEADKLSGRGSSRPQRDGIALRLPLARKAGGENQDLQRVSCASDAGVVQDRERRSGIGGLRRSPQTQRIRDAAASLRCLDEIFASVDAPDPDVQLPAVRPANVGLFGGPLTTSPLQKPLGRHPTGSEKGPRRPSHASDGPLGQSDPHAAGAVSDGENEPRVMYPCPFRKRNPARFNIRDHKHCAGTKYNSMSQLSHHIVAHHSRQSALHQCRRCNVDFRSQHALLEHLMLPKEQMCELRPALSSIDPEDGLSDGAEKALAGTLDPVDRTWDSVWRLVFPADKDIPAPEFHPVVELVEVEQALDDAQETLKTGLQDKLRLLLPDTIEDSYCTFLAGQLELVYETHRANIMRQCLTRSGSTDQPAPAKAAITKRESLVRRNTRRSRRSTMIQGLRHPDTSEITSDAPPEASARLPERNLKRLSIRSSQSDQKPAAYRTETIASPPRPFSFRPISYRSTSRAETKTPSATGDNNDYSSRDSGIGIACDVCEFETCQCKFPILSLVSPRTRGSLGTPSTPTTPITPTTTWPTPKQTPSAPDTPTKPSPVATKLSSPRTYPILDSILIGSGSGNQTKHPPLRHQPRLRIRTREMDVFGPSQVEVSETASAGEMFSPQSFKRRVTMLGRGGGMSG